MNEMNRAGANFSANDMGAAKIMGKPLYLVVPERNAVKVHRPPEGCTGTDCLWRAWNL